MPRIVFIATAVFLLSLIVRAVAQQVPNEGTKCGARSYANIVSRYPPVCSAQLQRPERPA